MKTDTWYGVYNFDILVDVFRLRREAIGFCRDQFENKDDGDYWKKYYQIIKVDIIPHVQSNAE